jgi:hypothetical protein
MTPLSPEDLESRYLEASARLAQGDPLYRMLVARIAKDVSWGSAMADVVYTDGAGPCTQEPHYSNARRVIVELGL